MTKSVFTSQICHSRTGEINPVKVSNLVKLYVQRYKYFRKHGRKMDEEEKEDRESASMHSSTWLDKDCLFLSIWSNKFAKSPPLHVFGPTMAIEWQFFVILLCSPYVLTSCKLEYSTLLPVSLSCLAINMYEYRNVVWYKVYWSIHSGGRGKDGTHFLTHYVQHVYTFKYTTWVFFLSLSLSEKGAHFK